MELTCTPDNPCATWGGFAWGWLGATWTLPARLGEWSSARGCGNLTHELAATHARGALPSLAKDAISNMNLVDGGGLTRRAFSR